MEILLHKIPFSSLKNLKSFSIPPYLLTFNHAHTTVPQLCTPDNQVTQVLLQLTEPITKN